MNKIKNIITGFIFLVLISSSPSAYSFARAEQEMAKTRKAEPTFSEIVEQAFKRENLDLRRIHEWKKKMKTAPLLPTLYAGYDRLLRQTDAVSVSDNISVSSSGIAVGPEDTDFDQTLLNADTLRFRAVWKLDELVFHPSTLAVSHEGREISKSRLALTDYLFKMYAERREAQAQYYFLRGSGNPKALLLREKVEALTDELDLFTGGVFSNQWRRE